MEEKEYLKKLELLRAEHAKQIRVLQVEYAQANNKVARGDIVVDHANRIRVDTIRLSFGSRKIPGCSYEGVLLTKGGRPYKSGKRQAIWDGNIKEIIKEKSDGPSESDGAGE